MQQLVIYEANSNKKVFDIQVNDDADIHHRTNADRLSSHTKILDKDNNQPTEPRIEGLRSRSLFQAVLNKMRWCAKQTVGAEGNPCWRLMLAWVEEQVAKSPEPERTIPVWRLEHLINTAYGTAKDDAEFGLQIRSLLKNEPGLEPRANGEVFKLQNQLDVARSEVALLRKEASDAWDKCEERRQEGIAFQLTARELRERLEEADMKIGSLHKRILEIGERKGEVNAVNAAERRKS